MAEIGLVASVFGVAAVGTSVATALYEAADIMINANQQIFALAKHVSQFTAVLKHMGQVLKTEETNCSKEVLHDIRQIKRSCKRTFKEINSTLRSKHFRRFVPVKWLFKRTKALELEARLDSQQSMLQCIIHTLTVSKLGRIHSRAKQDSEHITGLKEEIRLLKTFIMESYNNLIELRRAEKSTEEATQYRSMSRSRSQPETQHIYVDGNTSPPNTEGRSSFYGPSITRSPSPTSSAPKSESDDSNSDDEITDEADDDANGTKSKDQTDQATSDISVAERPAPRFFSRRRSSRSDTSDIAIHRESDRLLQMVPYRTRVSNGIRSDRLIPDRHGIDSDLKSATQEATKSVRLLLDKWTTSGSAPVSTILDEEAAREKNEAEEADNRRTSGPQPDRYRSSKSRGFPLNEDKFNPTHDRGWYYDSSQHQDDYMPQHRTFGPQQTDFWGASYPFPRPSDQLGGEILAAMRCTRGGIYYTKSNQFKQVHYVDQYPIYICALVPPYLISHNEWKPLNTELGRGLIRKEALDLLGYSYIETETGSFLLSADLDLREIEELVKLSYQALDRHLKERSKKVVKEKGWGEIIEATHQTPRMHPMNRVPGMYPDEPLAAPHHLHPLSETWNQRYPPRPPMPESWSQTGPPYARYAGHRPYTDYGNFLPEQIVVSQAPSPGHRSREITVVRNTRPILNSRHHEIEYQEQEATKETRQEVRFTLPRVQLGSIPVGAAEEVQPVLAKPDVPITRADEELQKVRQRLDEVKKKKQKAEKENDPGTASDIEYYVIPELEAQINLLLKRQLEEQEEGTVPTSQSEENKSSLHTAVVETESENSDDGGESVYG